MAEYSHLRVNLIKIPSTHQQISDQTVKLFRKYVKNGFLEEKDAIALNAREQNRLGNTLKSMLAKVVQPKSLTLYYTGNHLIKSEATVSLKSIEAPTKHVSFSLLNLGMVANQIISLGISKVERMVKEVKKRVL